LVIPTPLSYSRNWEKEEDEKESGKKKKKQKEKKKKRKNGAYLNDQLFRFGISNNVNFQRLRVGRHLSHHLFQSQFLQSIGSV
jgi:uncharacterized membrane protein